MQSRPTPWMTLLVTAASAAAQTQFAGANEREYLPTGGAGAPRFVAVDIDGDGDRDLIEGSFRANPRLLVNDGAGAFAVVPAAFPAMNLTTESIIAADFDGDGDMDAVFGTQGPDVLFVNDGTGTFTSTPLPGGEATMAVAAGDVDGDGDSDLVLGTSNLGFPAQNLLLLNDGRGAFADATAGRLLARNDDTYALALVDVDGDHDLDLIVGNRGTSGLQNSLHVNDGTGTFAVVTGQLPTRRDFTISMEIGDVDGDLDVDVVLGNQGRNRLLINEGGTLRDRSSQLPFSQEQTSGLALVDVDNDGDLDLVTANGWSLASEQNRLYLNDGYGSFTDVTESTLPTRADSTHRVIPLDADGDGDVDLAFAGNGPARLLFNDGTGVFTDTTRARLVHRASNSSAVLLGDLDGDGDNDLLLANGGPDQLLLNDGTGRFNEAGAGRLPGTGGQARGAALGDVDGDGDADAVIGNSGRNTLYLNDGSGTFRDASEQLPADRDSTWGVALGDVDGDGDLDLVVGNGGGGGAQNRLYLNDGAGRFADVTAGRLPAVLASTNALALGDVDGDGDLDLVTVNGTVATYFEQSRLYLNDGSGRFDDATAARLPAPPGRNESVILADLDGDGDLDAVLGNTQADDALYLNDGSGSFADVSATHWPLLLRQEATSGFGVLDADRDGDLDLIVAQSTSGTRLLLNDGNAVFADATALFPLSRGGRAVAVGDVDRDGDLDAVLARSGQSHLYPNLQRQLLAPRFAILGAIYPLDLYAQPAGSSSSHTGFVVVSGAAAAVPIAFGTLGTLFVDPAALAALPPVALPAATGTARAPLFIPNQPALLGASIYGQALIVDGAAPSTARLTGFVTDIVQ
ncbi:MAG: VCBS repeat-containing protein [Planctomycetota bacterium]